MFNILSTFTKLHQYFYPNTQSLLQLLIYAIPAIVICFLATVGIQKSVPPTPPSASADTSSSEPFLQGIKLVPHTLSELCILIGHVHNTFLNLGGKNVSTTREHSSSSMSNKRNREVLFLHTSYISCTVGIKKQKPNKKHLDTDSYI